MHTRGLTSVKMKISLIPIHLLSPPPKKKKILPLYPLCNCIPLCMCDLQPIGTADQLFIEYSYTSAQILTWMKMASEKHRIRPLSHVSIYAFLLALSILDAKHQYDIKTHMFQFRLLLSVIAHHHPYEGVAFGDSCSTGCSSGLCQCYSYATCNESASSGLGECQLAGWFIAVIVISCVVFLLLTACCFYCFCASVCSCIACCADRAESQRVVIITGSSHQAYGSFA